MKIVLDTNILAGACLGSYAANRILAACLNGRVVPLIGTALLAEYEDVINRDDVFKKGPLSREERNQVLDALLGVSKWTKTYYRWRPNLRDEADNHVLELAVAGGADYLVTRNLSDFKRSELLFPNLCICLPETLLEELS
ncbi:putative PIN family toxin of toxin-antitoxin system [Neisseria sp. HSC-16F19]|nr:putative toxin-antitoxin system toxin component, PIN family [Neisseria sp. HSC-16F19]MCP2040466.1 putative PIN family toxin of toxin-antitoxin system [Neisseria sp. HSC-16F19]